MTQAPNADRWARWVSTAAGVGFLRPAPGTLASLVGVALYLVFYPHWGVYLGVLALVTALGFGTIDAMERLCGEQDPSCVVIDEVAGMLITLFLLPPRPSVLVTAFFLFRAFDMFKIPPADRFERLPGARGVMLDDLMAGVYANLVMQAAVRLAGS